MPIAMPISTDTATSEAPTMTSTTMPVANTPSSSSITGKRSDIWKKYHINTTVLGKGHFASVRSCIDGTTGQRYAVKSISKTDSSAKPAAISREIKLLQEMKHESIIQLVDVFEDDEYVHIVTNLCHGGELFDKIIEKTADDNGVPCFGEHEAANIILQILNAVSYMHDHCIVHRDIKPENILFDNKDIDSPIKIIDMGLARKHKDIEHPMTTIVGTPYYIAPEVLKKKYDKSCDLWSVGVIAYILLCGYPPFNGKNTDQTHKLIVQGRYSFPNREWKYNSDDSIDFIRRLLTYDPSQRMTVEEALDHPWIVRYATNQDTVMKDTEGKSSADNVVPVKGLSKPRSLLLCGSRRKKNAQKKIRKSMFGIAA